LHSFLARNAPEFSGRLAILNSERTQQDSADKNEHGADRQHVEAQG
jgi:hypothetical protein